MIKRRNKKGDLTDLLIFGITLFILAIGFLLFAYIVPQITSGLNSANLNNTVEGASAIDQLTTFGTTTIQRGFFLLFVGLIMGIMVSSFFVDSHPIFLFMYIIMLGLSVFISVFVGNAYEKFIENDVLSETVASQGLISIVMSNLLTIVVAVGILSIIIIFAKFKAGSNPQL